MSPLPQAGRGADTGSAGWKKLNANEGAGSGPPRVRRSRGWPRRAHNRARQTPTSVARDPVSAAGAGPVYGALDLGTNNCRILIAVPAPGGFKVIDAFSRIVRLGEGANRTGQLSEDAMARTIKALRVCSNKLRWWDVKRVRMIATEACRIAGNGAEFMQRVYDETGLLLEIINGHTEAHLAVAGAAPLIDPDASHVLVFDIGGGSTELMWLDVDGASYKVEAWTSVPAGVVTLAEKFGGLEVDETVFEAMRAHVRPMLEDFAAQIMKLPRKSDSPDHLLGTSGTVTTISGVHLGLMRYDRSKVDGCWLGREEIANVTSQLLAMNYAERSASPCIGRERADLVLAGCAILEEIRHIWPSERVRVADRGLREGILATLMREDNVYAKPS